MAAHSFIAMKNLFTLLIWLVAASTFARPGQIYPVVTTSIIPVSLSSNAIYSMITNYGGGGGGGGGGFTGNANQFSVSGSVTNIKDGALVTNMVNRVSSAQTLTLLTSVNGYSLSLDDNLGTYNFNNASITAASFTGVGSFLTALNASQLSHGTIPLARIPSLYGFGSNTLAANWWTNTANLTFSGNVAFTGTLIAGNWASMMNPGTFSIYNVRSDTGTSAGTVTEATITDNGSNPWIGLQGTQDDTGSKTQKMVNVYFPLTQPTNYVAGDFIPTTGKIKYCYSNYVIYAVSPFKTNLISDLR